MAAEIYTPYRNGQHGGRGVAGRKIVGNGRGPFSFIPEIASGIQDWMVLMSSASYVPTDWTETKTNSGTIGMAAGGLALVSGAADTNNTTAQLVRSILPAADKRFACAFRANWTVVAKGTAHLGLMNTCVAPTATPPTNGVWFSKDTAGTGAIKTNFRGNSTTVTAVALHTAVLATDYEYGIIYTPVDATNGYADFFYRAANANDWTDGGRMTAAAGNGLAAALRLSFNITGSDANALTMTLPWWAVAQEL